MKKLAIFAAAIAAAACACAHAEETKVPVIEAPMVTTAPKLDAVLDDDCWKTARKFDGFINTAMGTPAKEPTEVWLCRDASHIYVAFYCHDSHPELIRAQQKRRNGELGYDDRITVNLDTQHTHLTPYYFKVNAIGTQTEQIPSGAAANITWRGDWYAAGKIVNDGWITEISIPFSLLRYADNCNTMGIAFTRTLARTEENTAWPDISPNYSFLKHADLTNLGLKGNPVRPVLMPYLVSSREPGKSFDDIGIDYKQEINSNTIGLLTYRPDFSNVQDAVATIDYTYTERYLSEQRPFFQEGSSLFPDSTVFYSRRVGNVDWGAKVFGNSGGSSFAALATGAASAENHIATAYAYRTEGKSTASGAKLYYSRSAIADELRTDPASPYLSECFSPGVYWEEEDGAGSTDITVRQYTAINSGRPNASSFNFLLDRNATSGRLGGEFAYDDVDPDFYVRDGYTATKGIHGPRAKLDYYKQIKAHGISDWSTNIQASRYRSPDGSIHHENVSFKAGLDFMNEWYFSTVIKDGKWLGKRDASKELHIAWLERHLYSSGGLDLVNGKRSGKDYRFISLRQGFELSPKLTLNGSWEWSKLGTGTEEEKKTQYTVSGNWEMDRERNLSIWMVGRDSKLNFCCTFKRTARSGADLYLIYGFPNSQETENRVAMKIVMPLAL